MKSDAFSSLAGSSPAVARHLLLIVFAVTLAIPLTLNGAAAQSATGSSSGANPQGLAISGDKPIQIESKNLQISEENKTATFTGDVEVTQDKTLIRSGKMVVHYADNGGSVASGTSKIERIEVSKKVYLKSEDQEATADHGTYVMANQLLTLEGDRVVLTQGKNIFVGCKLVLHVATSEANLESCGKRVMIQLDPESQSQSGQSTQ